MEYTEKCDEYLHDLQMQALENMIEFHGIENVIDFYLDAMLQLQYDRFMYRSNSYLITSLEYLSKILIRNEL